MMNMYFCLKSQYGGVASNHMLCRLMAGFRDLTPKMHVRIVPEHPN